MTTNYYTYPSPTQPTPPLNAWLWGAGMVILFGLIYTPVDYLLPQLAHPSLQKIFASQGLHTPNEIITEVIAPLKGLLFIIACLILGKPLYQSCRNFMSHQAIPWRKIAWQASLTFMGTAALAVPFHLTSLGWVYGRMSLSPFTEPYGWYYKRLLMPALAHMLMFRGLIFYFIFALLLTYILIYLCILWLYLHDVRLSWWQLISLSSSTFIIYQFQAPGYSDMLVFSLMLLPAIVPLTSWGQLSVITLCLATHEGSLIPLIALTFFAYERPVFLKTLAIYGIYLIFWLSNQSFNLTTALASQDVDQTPTWQWLLAYPSREFLGVIFAYKALWLLILVAIILLLRKKNYLMAGQIASLIFASLILTFLAVDTTRLVGFSFFALLLALKVCYHQARHTSHKLTWQRFFFITWLINLLFPSIYVGLNHPFTISTGLYYGLWLALRYVLS